MNAAGWLIRYVFPEKTYNDLKPLFDNGPVLLFTVAGLLGVVFVEIYRKSFKYEFSDAGVEITHGMFSANSHMIVARHITNVMLKRNFFELIMGVGHVIPVTSSGMGSGDRGVMGGFTTDAGTQNLRGGAFVEASALRKSLLQTRQTAYMAYRNRKM